MIDLITLALIKKYVGECSTSLNSKIDEVKKEVQSLAEGMKVVGESTTDPSIDGATVSGVKKFQKGNVVIFDGKEYCLVGTENTPENWVKLGDDDCLTKEEADNLYAKAFFNGAISGGTFKISEGPRGLGIYYNNDKTNKYSGVSVSDGNTYNILAQIGGSTRDGKGSKIVFDTENGYYIKNKWIATAEDEIVTKKDIIGITVDNFVQKKLDTENGIATISNDPTGGILKFENTAGEESGIAVNDGSWGIYAQLYAKKKADDSGARLNLNPVGLYYTKSDSILYEDEDEVLTRRDLVFKSLSSDSNIWELNGNYILSDDLNVTLQVGSSIILQSGTRISTKEFNDKIKYNIYDISGKIYYGTVDKEGTPEENGNALINFNNVLKTDNHIEYKVDGDYIPAHKKYVDETVDYETRDLFQSLEKNLQEDTSKTLIEVRNKSGATSTIVEVDNIDIVSPIAQHSVLGLEKGKELDDRVTALEKNPISVINMQTDITEDNLKAHIYPVLQISKEQIETIINSDVSILKVKFNVLKSSGTEIDTLVFYTTIDSIESSNSGLTAKTIKINAIRTNDEATIVYHAELLGNGEEFAPSINLTPSYIEHNKTV